MGHPLMKVKQLWETWDIRVLLLTSLLIQILLTFLAPFRRCCSSGLLKIFLWLLYLSADAVALFTIGLISSTVGDAHSGGAVQQHVDLLAFWAPFLILHLGGPDTITALALEDNELWRRHALQFGTQVVITIYVFVQSFRRSTGLLAPTLLMFANGCIKYLERTFALYEASIDRFRESHRNKPKTSPYYARLMEEYRCAETASIPAKILVKNFPSGSNTLSQGTGLTKGRYSPTDVFGTPQLDADVESAPPRKAAVEENDRVIAASYNFFDHFRGIIADALLNSEDRDESRQFFLKIKGAAQAFRMVEIELNFIYDVFYTKAFLVNRKRGWARLLSIISAMVSLLLFCFKDRSNYPHRDVQITFALLGGAIALDIICVIIFLLSDWFIIILSKNSKEKYLLKSLVGLFISWSIWVKNQWYHGRWSQSIIKYNMLQHCLTKDDSTANNLMTRTKDRVKNYVLERILFKPIQFDPRVGDFIFQELKKKAELAIDPESVKEVCSARGNLALQDEWLFVSEYLQPWTVDVDYDESLLTWHLATDLCYWTMAADGDRDRDSDHYCIISKHISDYIAHLFLKQKTLVSPVLGASDIRFQDTCADAKKFYSTAKESNNRSQDEGEHKMFEWFCNVAVRDQMVVWSSVAKIEESKSVFFEACHLAKQLNMFGEKQWEITAKVWVELLCYAALNCSPRSHVAELSTGGQLITFVWLLMAHLGLGERFRQTRSIAWTKLKIDK